MVLVRSFERTNTFLYIRKEKNLVQKLFDEAEILTSIEKLCLLLH